MKKIYQLTLILFLISVFNFSNAQNRNYVPMLNEGAHWCETYYYLPNPYGYNWAFELFLEGDTTINNLEYVKLYKGQLDVICQENYIWGPEYFCALREDISTQKVWILEAYENEESLYFDFNLGIGDTVPDDSHFIEEFSPVVVYAIDTITGFDGVDRRIWTFECEGETYGSQMIEGIGNKNGLLSSFFVPFEIFENLFCFTIDTTHVYSYYGTPECILPSDTCLTVGINEWAEQTTSNQTITAYPVPAQDFVYLQYKNEMHEGESQIQIMDFTGKIVYSGMIEQNSTSGKTINVRTWAAGIYIATLRNNGWIQGKCKIVVE